MTGRDFRSEYTAELSEQRLPEEAKRNILKMASDDKRRRRGVVRTHNERSRARIEIGVGLAACLAALLLFVSTATTPWQDADLSAPAGESRFRMVAYAAEEDVEVSSGDDLTAFNLLGDYRGGYDGAYTGALFSLEGEEIESVEFSLDKGELYLYAEQDYERDYGPEYESLLESGMEKEAADFAVKHRNEAIEALMGKLGSEENAVLIGESSGDGRLYTLSAGLRIGANGTVAFGDEEGQYNLEKCKFGFWAPKDDASDAQEQDPRLRFKKDLSYMDGATLKLTVRFKDGSLEEKTYLIRSGYLKCEIAEAENGQSTLRILPELADPETDSGVTTLYAVEVPNNGNAHTDNAQ